MPGFPRDYARIAENAFFWGTFDWIDIWDPKTLLDAVGVDDAMQAADAIHDDAPHIPVLLDEVLDGLAIAAGETYVDATFGAGGYTSGMLARGARVFAFDRDPDAIAAGAALVESAAGALTLVPATFSALDSELAARDAVPVQGVTMDIGVSSMQLDQAERGFSFQSDGPLDMRMSQEGMSAADFLNT
eukprot:gene42275-52533_t